MQNSFEEQPESANGFDLKRLLSKIGKNWYWFVITVTLAVTGAYFYLSYTIPVYSVTTNILIKQPNENSNKLGSPFAAGTTANANTSDFINEIFKLKSVSVVGEVVDSMQYNISIFETSQEKKVAVNLDSFPLTVSVHKKSSFEESPVYQLSLYPTSYKLKNEQAVYKGNYNQPLSINGDTLLLNARNSYKISANSKYEFQYISRTAAIRNYIACLTIEPMPRGGEGMLQVSVLDLVPERAKRSVSVLVQSYDIANLDYNNQALRKEMSFLKDRLATATSELEQQEQRVQEFKAGNRIYDVSSSANQLLNNLPVIDSKKSDNSLKEDLLNLVESNINANEGNEEIVPNSSGLQEAGLSDQINKYNQLVIQKRKILDNSTSQDLRLPIIDGQLEDIRSNVTKNIQSIRNEIKVNANSLSTQESKITSRFSTIPTKEKELIELSRILNIKESLYTFLLQRKEEKDMQLASTEIAKSIIIDDGLGGVTQSPNMLTIYGIALGIGLLLPALFIVLKVMMNKKIETRQDIETLTTLPIAGEISNITSKDNQVIVTPNNVSAEAEQFRTLRTNIYYLTTGIQRKTMLITSGKSGEGKSFVSLNLANTMAIANKKVALLEFDLRNIGLSEKLGLLKTIGLANYLAGEAEMEDIIQPTSNSENLFFISSGFPLAPNPGELILGDRMDALFDYLKQNFDAIVIDTPPVGPVSDALTLAKWADLSFFVIRHKETLLSTLKLINKLNADKKLPQLKLIINGIKDKKEFSYGNDYGYGYGYGYEYGIKKKKGFKALLNN